jgi:hypothetical protein
MESLQPDLDSPAKKNQTPLIIAISAVVLCCCCTIAAIAGYYGYFTLSTSEIETLPLDQTTPEVDESVSEPTPSTDFEVPSTDLDIGEAPTGGLGNDILRNDTWQYVAFAAMGQGCDQPLGDETQIDVLQEPQNGVWVEQWTVACASGDSYAYEVEYILDDTGATFNIKSLP